MAKAGTLVQSALFVLYSVSLTKYSISESRKNPGIIFLSDLSRNFKFTKSLIDKVRLDDGNFLHKWVIVSLTAKHTWFVDVQIF